MGWGRDTPPRRHCAQGLRGAQPAPPTAALHWAGQGAKDRPARLGTGGRPCASRLAGQSRFKLFSNIASYVWLLALNMSVPLGVALAHWRRGFPLRCGGVGSRRHSQSSCVAEEAAAEQPFRALVWWGALQSAFEAAPGENALC